MRFRPNQAVTAPYPRAAHYRVVLLFFVSGAAALVYQVCWQRLLFESVGVDMESVTIIVSTFMLGLGLGSLAGGELADRYPGRTLELFALIELATALFGILSPALIRAAGAAAVNRPAAVIAAVNFGLLLIPTTLMGATLPILVTRLVRRYRNLGVSVGLLYFANTLGAALGAGLTGFVALYYIGLAATIYSAAALNVAVSALAWIALRDERA
ncbi:MAG: fused MFS/spermidine synthase [Steroidobacterales bacterium]